MTMYLRRSQWTLALLLLTAAAFSAFGQKSASRPANKPQPPAKQTAPAKTEAQPAQAQPAVWESWETLKPENEDFSILMPKDTATEVTQFPYHKLELNTRLYLSPSTSSPVVAVASMSGIKSNPAAYTDFERFNSYVDAFKTFFPPKVRKDGVTKLTLVSNKPFHGYTGRVYKLTVGDLTGTVNAYVTKKRFYAIAVLNTKKDDALEEKFLSSFVIPDKPIDQPSRVSAAAEPTLDQNTLVTDVASTGQNQPRPDGRKPGSTSQGATTGTDVRASVNNQEDNTEFGATTVQPNAQQNQNQQNPKQRAPIQGGVLNGKAIYFPLPELPAGERAGVVLVQILVDEQGSVTDAKVVSGPANLHGAAINAARLARFMPTVLAGEPVKVSGTLAYNFARAN